MQTLETSSEGSAARRTPRDRSPRPAGRRLEVLRRGLVRGVRGQRAVLRRSLVEQHVGRAAEHLLQAHLVHERVRRVPPPAAEARVRTPSGH